MFIYANIDGRTGTPGPGFGGGATPGGMGRTPGFGATPAAAAWRPGTVLVCVRASVKFCKHRRLMGFVLVPRLPHRYSDILVQVFRYSSITTYPVEPAFCRSDNVFVCARASVKFCGAQLSAEHSGYICVVCMFVSLSSVLTCS